MIRKGGFSSLYYICKKWDEKMAKLCPLFSGSKANCTYVSGNDGALLIDTGASCSAILKSLDEIGENAERIRAILITHEHTDHIRGLKTLLKKLNVPVMASEKTLDTLVNMNILSDDNKIVALGNGDYESDFGKITRFETMHDCEGSSGYRIDLGSNSTVAVCTDLGVVTPTVREAISGCSTVLLESNHDLRMLQSGPYPPELKIRIAGERGHLSNAAAACELVSLLKSGTKRFVLGHLSENNNLPVLALRTSESALIDAGARKGVDYTLFCALGENREAVYF